SDGIVMATYVQTGNTLTISGFHTFNPGDQFYLTITSGGAHSGIATVTSVADINTFSIQAPDSANRSGACLYTILAGILYLQSGTTVTAYSQVPHYLSAGNNIYVPLPSGYAAPRG